MGATWWTDPAELDDDQKKVVALPPDGRHLVLGPPGSGKTNLLLLRATYLYKKGIANIAILAFGRVLREFLATGTAHYPFATDKIQTYVRWGTTLLRDNGIDFEESGDFEKVRGMLLAALAELAAKGKAQNVFDCILLDEAQDYSPDEIAVISKFTVRLFAVGDSSQQITDKKGALDILVSDGVQVSRLEAHYRNGLKICRVADGIRNMIDKKEGLEASSNYNEGPFPSTVRHYPNLKIHEQADEAAREIETQLVAYPGELIGVVCPRQEELKVAATVMNASSIANQLLVQHGEYVAFDPDRRVILATVHGAKGLEFRAVHLLGTDKIKNFKTQKNMAYTAVTRCKTSLSVYHESPLPGYFEKGIEACNDRPGSEPSLDDLFL